MTSNQPESLEIPGTDRRIVLHIVAGVESDEEGDESSSKRKRPGEVSGSCMNNYQPDSRVDSLIYENPQLFRVVQVRVPVKAQFLVDGRAGGSGLQFLDETVIISHFDDCKYAEEEDIVGKIAMGNPYTSIALY